jgi:hypothetical protein
MNMVALKDATSKDDAARILARRHYEIEPGISRVIRLMGANERDPKEPIKLLEVNRNTIPAGIVPLHFGPHGIRFATVIVEITPREFEEVRKGFLRLPEGWTMDRQYPKPRNARSK